MIPALVGEGGDMPKGSTDPVALEKMSTDAWKKLNSKKIFFGHQSVGFNILDGVEQLKKERVIPQDFTVVKTGDASSLTGPMLAHAPVGENGDPASKLRSFTEHLDKGFGARVDIAFFKFCYVDITAYSDVDRFFREYKEGIDALKKKYPRVRFVHVTVPLTVTKMSLRSLAKSVLGKEDNNIKRNKFNDLLRREYAGRDPIFDLAKIESTLPDGSRSSFTKGGETYYSLAPAYSDDGGHLNDQGKRAAARELMLLLIGPAQD
jgi:hypothetical protein